MRRPARTTAAILLLLIVAAVAPFAGIIARGEVPTFRDHESYFLPLRWHTAEALAGGELPLWNPYSGGGEPWLANPQTGVFYPPAWLMVVLPFELGYVLFLTLHLALLGWGAFTLFRRWASDGAALVAALALMYSGPVFSLLDIGNNLASFAWLPFVIRAAAERRESRARGPLVDLIAALSLSFLGGEPLFAAVAALAAVAILLPRDWKGALLAGIGSAGVSAVQLLPFLEWVSGSERAAGLDPGDAFRHAVGPGDWLALALPMASASNELEPLRGAQTFIPSLYIGVPIVILALAAGLGSLRTERAERRRVLAYLLVSFALIVVLSAAGGWEAGREILVRVGANAVRYPARLVPIGALIVAGLAAIGLERVRREPLGTRLGLTLSIAVLGGLRFLTVEPITEETTLLRFVIFLAWLASFGLVFVAFPRWLSAHGGQALLGAALVAELLLSVQPFLASRAETRRIEPWSSAIGPGWSLARVREGGSEVAAAPRAWLAGYLNLYGRHLDISTAAPVIDRRAFAFQEAIVGGSRPDLLDFAGGRWVLSSRTSLGEGYVPTNASRSGVRLFDNRSALPAIQLWRGGTFVASPEEALDTVLSAPPAAGAPLLVSGRDTHDEREPEPAMPVPLRDARINFSPAAVRAVVDANEGGILVVTQRISRGWSVEVNGAPAEPLAVNGIFRGVRVTSGKSEIEWRYRPLSLSIGAVISLIFVTIITPFALSRRR